MNKYILSLKMPNKIHQEKLIGNRTWWILLEIIFMMEIWQLSLWLITIMHKPLALHKLSYSFLFWNSSFLHKRVTSSSCVIFLPPFLCPNFLFPRSLRPAKDEAILFFSKIQLFCSSSPQSWMTNADIVHAFHKLARAKYSKMIVSWASRR